MNLKLKLKMGYDLISKSKNRKEYRDPETGAEIRYFVENKILYIYVNCTDDLKDWITNIFGAFGSKKLKIGNYTLKCHKGYYMSASNLSSYLIKKNKKFFKGISTVFVSGYSMGGGISPLLTILLYKSLPDLKYICSGMEGTTYCRFDKNFKLPINVEIYNVVNGNDTITKVWAWFKKLGKIIHIGEKRKWYKTGIKINIPAKLNEKSFLRKFFDIPEHQYSNFRKNLNSCKI